MTLSNQSNIVIFLRQLEVFAGHKITYPDKIGFLLDLASREGKAHVFEDLIFHSKFIVKTQEVMNRIGPKADGFEKLSSEIQTSVKRALELIRTLIESNEQKEEFEKQFFSFDIESYSQFMKLFSDLSLIKNWQVDGKPLSYEERFSDSFKQQETVEPLSYKTKPNVKSGLYNNVERKVYREGPNLPLIRIQQSAWLGTLFVVLLICIDPPVTVLGWCLTLGIAVFLVYIVLQIYVLQRTPKL